MFNIVHFIGYSTCRNIVQILHPNLNLSRLSSFRRNLDKFIIEICKASSYQFLEFVVRRHASHGEQIHEIDSMGNLEAKEN